MSLDQFVLESGLDYSDIEKYNTSVKFLASYYLSYGVWEGKTLLTTDLTNNPVGRYCAYDEMRLLVISKAYVAWTQFEASRGSLNLSLADMVNSYEQFVRDILTQIDLKGRMSNMSNLEKYYTNIQLNRLGLFKMTNVTGVSGILNNDPDFCSSSYKLTLYAAANANIGGDMSSNLGTSHEPSKGSLILYLHHSFMM